MSVTHRVPLPSSARNPEAGGVREGFNKFRPFIGTVGIHIPSFCVIRRF